LNNLIKKIIYFPIFILFFSTCGSGEIEESVEILAGGSAIQARDFASEKIVKNNMRLLQIAVENHILMSETNLLPATISDLDLPIAQNPFNSSSPAFVDGEASNPGEVGYQSSGSSYIITGYGENEILEFKMTKNY